MKWPIDSVLYNNIDVLYISGYEVCYLKKQEVMKWQYPVRGMFEAISDKNHVTIMAKALYLGSYGLSLQSMENNKIDESLGGFNKVDEK